MAYQTSTQDPQYQLVRLGGLNERFSPHALPAPDFSALHGLYPARDGALSRLPGIRPLALAGDGDVAVWQIFQPNDGTDNLIVQTSDGTERIFTLDELFGRTVVSDLTYTPLQDDEDMPTAIILQDAANGVDGGSIGASTNTWYDRDLTSNPLNEDSIIVAFDAALDTFTLAPGTYRIRGYAQAAFTVDQDGAGADTVVVGYQAALDNITDGVTTATGSPMQWSFARVTAGMELTWGPYTLESKFDDTFDVTGSNKVFKIKNIYNTTASDGGTAFTRVTGKAAGATAVLNGAAVRQPYLKLVISKVA
jgi:hypothetical protein